MSERGKRKGGTSGGNGGDMNGEKRRRKDTVDKDDGPRMFICGEEGCEYESKWKHTLKKHKAMIHGIDVTYYLCNVDGCEYKAKEPVILR